VWLDSHCHLSASEFDADRDAVLARAREAGVETLVAIGSGYGVAHNGNALELASQDPRIFATVGVHPHEADTLDEAGRADIASWLTHERVIAVGECGLDYHYMQAPREIQREVLAWQLGLARERALPVSIHVRGDGAFDELLELWKAEGRGELRGVLHCYTGTLEFARRALEENLSISFSGIVTFKKDHGLRDVARALPLDRLLVETDAPLLAPEGHRGKRNEPAWVLRVGETLAALHQVSAERIAEITTRNAQQLFGLPS